MPTGGALACTDAQPPLAIPAEGVGRRVLSRLFWDGTGTVARKVYVPSKEAGAWIIVPRVMTRYVRGFVPERWVLVVRSAAGMDHYVKIDAALWEQLADGDPITPEHELFPEFGSEVFNKNRWKPTHPRPAGYPNTPIPPRPAPRALEDRPPATDRAVEAAVERRAEQLAAERQAMAAQPRRFRQPG